MLRDNEKGESADENSNDRINNYLFMTPKIKRKKIRNSLNDKTNQKDEEEENSAAAVDKDFLIYTDGDENSEDRNQNEDVNPVVNMAELVTFKVVSKKLSFHGKLDE